MNTLESIVLPLEQSRALVEHGIVLNTALYWFRFTKAEDRIIEDGYSVATEFSEYYAPVKQVCPAPVLSELLDAIRAKTEADAEFSTGKYRMGRKVKTGLTVDWGEIGHTQGFGDTDLLAAATLLMEVSR